MKNVIFTIIISSVVASTSFSAEEKDSRYTRGLGACTAGEKWQFTGAISEFAREGLTRLVSSKSPVVVGLSDAVTYQRVSKDFERKIFAAYWKNRALYEAGLVHASASGFEKLVAMKVAPESLGVQLASLECLNLINRRYPRIKPDSTSVNNFPELLNNINVYGWGRSYQEILFEAVVISVMNRLSPGMKDADRVAQFVGLLRGGGRFEALAKGMLEAAENRDSQASEYLEAYFKSKDSEARLKRFDDNARITLARTYYTRKDFDKAASHLGKVSKDSNLIVRVLAELSWVYLVQEKYGDSIGTAMNFQGRGLFNTFAPEALMMMAMALNELCQFPDSLRSVQYFRKNYRASYEWLRNWYVKNSKRRRPNFYGQIVEFLEKEKSSVPQPVLNEWIRSPVFIGHQQEINLLLDEEKAAQKLRKDQIEEYKKLRYETAELAKTVAAERKSVLADMKSDRNKKFPIALKQKMSFLNRQKIRLANLKNFKKPLRDMTRSYKKQSPGIQRLLIARINADINLRNLTMLRKLKDVASNTYLVEVEIYNGASDDVVWRNANPDFEKFSTAAAKKAAAEKSEEVWNWGPSQVAGDGRQEVWADELGTLKANIKNNCSNKDKYLALSFNKKS